MLSPTAMSPAAAAAHQGGTYEQAQVSYLDLAGRFRRRPEPERGEPARRGRRAAPRLGGSAGRLAPIPRQAGRRGEREHTGIRGIGRERRGRRDGSKHVRPDRWWGLGGRGGGGLVGGRGPPPPPPV